MLKKLIKNKKAQNTAEYAILISLVVAGIIAMQTYAQRALQGRVRDASQYLMNRTNALGTTVQYEPYYVDTAYTINADNTTGRTLAVNQDTTYDRSTRTRATGGSSNVLFCAQAFGDAND